MKDKKWSTVKEVLFTFFAVSKILQWMDNISEATQGGDIADAGAAVLMRVLNRDLPLVLVCVCFVLIDKLKGKYLIKLAIGYAAAVVVILGYTFVIDLIWGVPREVYFHNFVGFSLSFIPVTIILGIKEYFNIKKAKTADEKPKEGEQHEKEMANN
jgi:hypothetical protein